MKRVRLRTLVACGVVAASAVLLFATSQRVQKAEETLAKITTDAAQEQETMKVLRAEWDYLNNPERLEALATKYLDMAAPAPSQMVPDAAQVPVPSAIGEDDRATQMQPVAAESGAP